MSRRVAATATAGKLGRANLIFCCQLSVLLSISLMCGDFHTFAIRTAVVSISWRGLWRAIIYFRALYFWLFRESSASLCHWRRSRWRKYDFNNSFFSYLTYATRLLRITSHCSVASVRTLSNTSLVIFRIIDSAEAWRYLSKKYIWKAVTRFTYNSQARWQTNGWTRVNVF